MITDDIDAPNDHRRDLRHFQRYSTPGYKSRKITRIVDTMHFAPSHASRLLQVVDMVSFLHYRIQSGRDTDPRAVRANHALWDHLVPVVHKTHCWWPSDVPRRTKAPPERGLGLTGSRSYLSVIVDGSTTDVDPERALYSRHSISSGQSVAS